MRVGVSPRRGWWFAAAFFIVALAAAMTWSYLTLPTSNTAQGRFDAIVVLGSPTELHGEVSEEQRWRVDEGVREFRAGRAPHLIFSGAAVAYRFVEGDAMAAYARSLGVPAAAILTETQARNTIQNISYSLDLMKAHGWSSMEVVSTADHTPRAALILRSLARKDPALKWRVQVAPTPGLALYDRALYRVEETVSTALLRWFGLRLAPVLHAIAVVEHGLRFATRWVWYHLTGQLKNLR